MNDTRKCRRCGVRFLIHTGAKWRDRWLCGECEKHLVRDHLPAVAVYDPGKHVDRRAWQAVAARTD